MSDLWASLAGGALIGLAVRGYWILNGRVAGISGQLAELADPGPVGRGTTPWFLAGLFFGGLALGQLQPSWFAEGPGRAWPLLAGAGLLVGLGTRCANGCTSGHGLWGLSLGRKRSLVATSVFMAVGGVAVFVVRHGLGGAS